MAGKPGFRVRPSWPRPDAALLAAFGEASAAQIADCMSRLGAMDSGIRPIWPSARLIGPALTVWCHSGDNLMLHKGLSLVQPGDIVVMNTQGNTGNSGFGELLATSAVKLGVAGIIIDGTVRDAAALQALRLPVYARGLCPNGCNKDGAGEVGAVIACGGVAVRPGDIIVADCDGVTVVPLDDAAQVAELAAGQIEREHKRLSEIERGVLVRPEIDEYLRKSKVID
ncbi:MAG TPA: RraA family protein [Candidatus Sulfopaludibacter sp.]|jgi:regulator of RNase E activity RraA|nr:RraA family protein [Candidatus Sulfopaludibacter sp.]